MTTAIWRDSVTRIEAMDAGLTHRSLAAAAGAKAPPCLSKREIEAAQPQCCRSLSRRQLQLLVTWRREHSKETAPNWKIFRKHAAQEIRRHDCETTSDR